MEARMRLFYQFIVALLLVGVSGYFSGSLQAATITSASGGTWNVGSTWVGGVPPGPGDDVVVQNTHFITVSSNAEVQSLTVNATSFNVLTINSGVTLTVSGDITVSSTAGATLSQITCNGTLDIGGDINLNAVSIPAKSAIEMGANSAILLEGNIVFGNAGRIYSPGGDFWTFTYNGSAAQTMSISGTDIVYNRVVIDNTAGVTVNGAITTSNVVGSIEVTSGTFSNGGYSVTGTTDSTLSVSNGATLELGGTTGLPAGFDMVLGASSTVAYTGSNQTIAMPNNSQTYGNLSVNVSGTATLGASLDINGNLTISSGTMDASNGDNYNITLDGNWINSGTFTSREGTVSLTGTGSQAITSNGSSFYNLVFNNAGVIGFSLNDDVTVSNNITMTDGIISTGSNTLILTNTGSATLSGYSSASFVNGNLRRYIASNTNTYGFPVGDGLTANDYHLAELINNNMDLTYVTGSFTSLSNHNDNDMTASDASLTYLSIATDGVWILTPNTTSFTGSYGVRLHITNFNSQFTDNEFAILKRPENSTTAADWTATGTINSDNGDGRLVAHGYGLRTGYTSFSQFGMGRASTTGAPLPVELISFTANPTEHATVNLEWITATEIQNDFFVVERSIDGNQFEEVGTIDAAGYSTITQEYFLEDTKPENGVNYYRLKQVDLDGTTTYSETISVFFDEIQTDVTVAVYPNPIGAGGILNIEALNTDSFNAQIALIELGSGRVVVQQDITDLHSTIDLGSKISSGIYVLQINDGQQVHTSKLLVK